MVGLFTIIESIEGAIKTINQPFKKDEPNHTYEREDNLVFQGEENTLDEVNVLLLGSDSRGEEQARTDTIMIAHYDPQTSKIKLISLMRDMLVSVPDYGQQKLNAAFTFGGPELLRETIKENFGVNLHYYAMIDFEGFEEAVDLLVPNGIEVDIPYEMSDGIEMTLEKGKQRLHGKELLGYVRFRQDRLSDFGRVQRQQEVISKLKEEAVGLQNIAKLPELLDLLHTYLDTNIHTSTLLSIGKNVLTKESGEIETLRIPEDGSFENKRHDTLGDVLEIDFSQNKQSLQAFLQSVPEP
ncbi:LCP family protein [Mesobacillus maritimus]|uniref:Regulatory protein MsrR n=2 Tax=Mesobacillus maritimus TaxID=1643336 RepID=A0ABS7K7X9_9BACI|nr:LCP family protein [Mesobacillus maritimus]